MKRCYYCGKMANSKEHLPPKQMFKGFNVINVTVKSCNEHNSSKSFEDDSIIKSMIMAIEKSIDIVKTPEIEISINNANKKYNQVKNKVTEEKLFYDKDNNIICLDYSIDLNKWIKKLSAGMVYYKTKYFDEYNKYDDSKVFERNSFTKNKKYYSDYLDERRIKLDLERLSEYGEWKDSWILKNNYPENIYFFKYRIIKSHILFKHVFYKSFVFYNLIEISEVTREKIIERKSNSA